MNQATIRATDTIAIEVVKKLLDWKVDPDCIREVITILQNEHPLSGAVVDALKQTRKEWRLHSW